MVTSTHTHGFRTSRSGDSQALGLGRSVPGRRCKKSGSPLVVVERAETTFQGAPHAPRSPNTRVINLWFLIVVRGAVSILRSDTQCARSAWIAYA